MNHIELFAGIGGFRQALTLLGHDFGIEEKTVAFSEIDESAVKTYKASFDTSGEVEMGDIVAFNQNKNNIFKLPDFDFLTGGFPCQAFSMMGKQKGFSDMRGNVFFQILEILKVKKPKYILLENVRNLKSHDGGKTFEFIIQSIRDCGYNFIYNDIFNSEDFGLAQKRNRVFIFATTENLPNLQFSHCVIKDVFQEIKSRSSLSIQQTTHEILEKQVEEKFYLSDTIKPTILSNGTKSYHSKSDINPLVARPLTATMVKMHRACQDNYFSDGYIHSVDPVRYLETKYTKEELCKQRIRKITPQEAFMLQGFSKDFFNRAKSAGISNAQLYKQAGNAVSVNTVYAILYYLFVYLQLN